MKAKSSGKNMGFLIITAALITCLLFIAWLVYFKPKLGDTLSDPAIVNDIKKLRMVTSLRTNLNKTVEAEKNAVLAMTVEESTAFAEQALALSAAAEDNRNELGKLIEMEKASPETDLFRQFNDCWDGFRQIDQNLLRMSILHTDLKAYTLSFDSFQKSIRQLETSLDTVAEGGVPSDKTCGILKLSQRTLIAVLRIQSLQLLHIAERRPEKMEEIEASIQMQDALAIQSLDALSVLAPPKTKPLIEAALAAYTEMWRIHSEVINLSRENSESLTLAFSLGQKHAVTVECRNVLDALEKNIQSRFDKAVK
jgi:hypothetical protein